MNILVISQETWTEKTNGGNVLSNIFKNFDTANFAQIYCSAGLPENSICSRYFQLSDRLMLKNQFRIINSQDIVSDPNDTEMVGRSLRSGIFREVLLLAREAAWSIINWKSEALKNFILDFHPDIIFAPCYSYIHTSKIALYAQELTACPVISYISDDNYSCKRISFSPSFWINRFITRKYIRKLFAKSRLIYTMTQNQIDEYEPIFNVKMKILCKGGKPAVEKTTVNNPIRLIYGGGLYLNRWKILAEIKKALENVNKDGIKAQLHIYSSTELPEKVRNKLNDNENSFLFPAISYEKLMSEYKNSDIALHVEAFDKKNLSYTRLSFSTKIVDCLSSGCATVAVGPEGQAGIDYLEANDGAVCIRDKNEIAEKITELINHPETILQYSKKAAELLIKNHSEEVISEMVKNDFEEIFENEK